MLLHLWCFVVQGAGMWQWLRADEGGHPQHPQRPPPPPPRAQAAALSLPKAERLGWEDVLRQPNEINHWILALALQTWPRLSTSGPVWKGQRCKCCCLGGGVGGSHVFRSLHNLSSHNCEDLRIKKPWLHHSLLAPHDVSVCAKRRASMWESDM